MIDKILDKYPNHAPVITLLDSMTSKQIQAIHSIGDCYVSLTRSEGFGLTIFDAYNYGKKIICTGYGGHIDFLKSDYEGLVKYSLGKVFGMLSYSGFDGVSENQKWAYPDSNHASVIMNVFYKENCK